MSADDARFPSTIQALLFMVTLIDFDSERLKNCLHGHLLNPPENFRRVGSIRLDGFSFRALYLGHWSKFEEHFTSYHTSRTPNFTGIAATHIPHARSPANQVKPLHPRIRNAISIDKTIFPLPSCGI
jgi:hypothetical protein